MSRRGKAQQRFDRRVRKSDVYWPVRASLSIASTQARTARRMSEGQI
jgi:hypothetical protein